MQFGLLTYGYSINVGDAIQSIAASQFLPRVDVLIERDRLHLYNDDPRTFVIFNGWFALNSCWPPPASIDPLFVSFYAYRQDELVNSSFRHYYKQHEPIGCRSVRTLRAFQDIGVNAYFSGCLTLTLPKSDNARAGQVYAVDVEPGLYSKLVPERIRNRAIHLSHGFPTRSASVPAKAGWPLSYYLVRGLNKLDPDRRLFRSARQQFESFRHKMQMAAAEELLKRYSEASLVITGRLHCALPCLALGTPVVVLRHDIQENPRFAGLRELVRCYGRESKALDIDWDQPGPNPDAYLAYAKALRSRCEEAVARAQLVE